MKHLLTGISLLLLLGACKTYTHNERSKNETRVFNKDEGLVEITHTDYTDQDDPVFEVVEEMPQFPEEEGSLANYLRAHVVYPEDDKKNGRTGTVYVQFVVWNDGSIKDVQLLPGSESRSTVLMQTEALRVVREMPNWKPGKQSGKNVNVMFRLPIVFKL